MFDFGMQVVCIRDDWRKRRSVNEIYPIKDQVLTIRDIRSYPEDYTYEVGLQFEEIVNTLRMYPGTDHPCEIAFPGSAFRPVKKTDINELLKIAKTAPKLVDEELEQ